MNIHTTMPAHRGVTWSDLSKEGRIAAIKAVYEPGMSAREIAMAIGGISRNAVVGIYGRHGQHLEGYGLRPFRTSGRNRKDGKRSKVDLSKYRGYVKATPKLKAEPVVKEAEPELHICGQPLISMRGQECRWPVNEAEIGEMHLFCGLPSDGTYCSHHKAQAYRGTTP